MKKIVLYPLIILIIVIILFIYKKDIIYKQHINNNSNRNKLIANKGHNIINSDEYNKKYKKLYTKYGKYKNLDSFLKDRNKEFTGLNVDLTKDNFVVCLSGNNGKMVYTPIYNKDVKNGEYDFGILKYQYMSLIDKALKKKCIYGGVGTKGGSKILFEDDVRIPLKNILNDIFNKRVNVYNVLGNLEKIKNNKKPKEYIALQAYLYEFIGDYKKANTLRKKMLDDNKKTDVLVQGVVKDGKGNPLQGVILTLLNNPKVKTKTNKDGKYTMKFKSYPLSHLRIVAKKQGYSDGFYTIYLDRYLAPSWGKRVKENFVLHKANNIVQIDLNDKKNIKEINGKKYFVLKFPWSIYYVPVGRLYYMNGKRYEGTKLKIYNYEFPKGTDISNLATLDTFSPVYGYVGNLMKTFGMPYIQFFTLDGKELFIRKKYPMILINKVYNMKELYENHDKIYQAVTTGDMEYLWKLSKKGGYPITYDWLIKNHFLRWPARWVLVRNKGTWVSIPQKVIDKKGVIQAKFYEVDF